MALPLELPTIQNWSCHNCGGCCRQHAVEITAEEKQRIEQQSWDSDPAFADRPSLFVWHAGPIWNKRYRLAHRGDGGCIFLNEQGLCRIHAKFGEAAKPLACRLYPYTFHPAGNRVTLSLRFSCPSVTGNAGKPVAQQLGDLKELERLVVPEAAARAIEPPFISPGERLDWRDTTRITRALEQMLTIERSSETVPFPVHLLRTLFVVSQLHRATFTKIRGDRVDELLEILANASVDEVAADLSQYPAPSPQGNLYFRLLAAQAARKDNLASLARGLGYRLALLFASLRFVKGTGPLPRLHDELGKATFEQIEAVAAGWNAEFDALWSRYFRVKVQGLHFCGRAYFDVPLAEGYASLTLVLPITMWLARWFAAAAERAVVTLADVTAALHLVDHNWAYAPAFAHWAVRRQIRVLFVREEIPRLVARYCGVK